MQFATNVTDQDNKKSLAKWTTLLLSNLLHVSNVRDFSGKFIAMGKRKFFRQCSHSKTADEIIYSVIKKECIIHEKASWKWPFLCEKSWTKTWEIKFLMLNERDRQSVLIKWDLLL